MLRKPMRAKPGGWVEMWLDAVIVYRGIKWYRAQHGFGGEGSSHPREDWIAALPHVCAGAHRYLKDTGKFGRPVFGRDTFDPDKTPGCDFFKALDLAIAKALPDLKRAQAECAQLKKELAVTAKRLDAALKKKDSNAR